MAASSLGEFLVELFAETVGEELALASIGGHQVRLVTDLSSPMACMNGTAFQPVVQLTVDGLPTREQAVNVDSLHEEYFTQNPPSLEWLAEAQAQLAAWRARMDKRLLEVPAAKLDDTMPFDVSFLPGPLRLAQVTLDEGPPGPRPVAGKLGARAQQTAAQVRELPLDVGSDEMCAFGAEGYAIRIGHTPEDADEQAGWIRVASETESALILYSNPCERGDAFAVDGSEPLFRLLSDWLCLAIEQCSLAEPEFPDPRFGYPGIPLRRWLLFGDDGGPPLDHRIENGAIRDYTYADVDVPLPSGALDAMPRARALYHTFIREIVDPDARCEPG